MKRKLYTVLLFILGFIVELHAQGEANIWYFGVNAGLNFNSGTPVPLLDGQMNTLEGCAVLSNSAGQLLFYTDGVRVWDRNHNVMPNGSGLLGHSSSTQSATIVQKPGSPNIFVVITVDWRGYANGLRYSEIDLTLNGGLGDVTAVKNVLLYSPTSEKLTVVKHDNNIDYWVLSHGFGNNTFYAHLLTSSGFSAPVQTNIGIFVPNTSSDFSLGTLKASPDGSKIVACYQFLNVVELFDFDNSTGVISNPQTVVNSTNWVYGAEFSSNNEVLYISAISGSHIYQLDLTSSNIPASINDFTIGGSQIGSLQLGPDNKIYVAVFNSNYLHVIHNPEVIGTGCNLMTNDLYLGGRVSQYGLPCFSQSIFYNPTIQLQNACVGENVNFSFNTSTITSASWNFGDGFTSSDLNPTHIYTTSGIYTVSVNTISPNGAGTATRDIIISEVPTATQPSNILECDDNNDGFYSFDLTQNENTILNGQDASQFYVRYFSGTTEITSPTDYQNQIAYTTETITAEVYNVDNGNCKATTTFDIQVFESPMPATNIQPITACDNTSFGTDSDGRIIFDLTQRENEILNGQSSSVFTVEYYTDSALLNIIAAPNNYINTTSTETIYVKVFNTQNPSCEATTSFQIEVFSLPVVNSPVVLKQCDDNNDGYSAFNLTEAIELINNDTTLTFSFFETTALATAGTSPITNTMSYTNQTVSNDTIYVRVENANGCYRVVTLNLVVSTTLISSAIQEHFYMCDDTASGSNTDGIATFDFSSVDAIISSQYPAGQLLTITYYESLVDALAEQNAIVDISNFTNSNSPNIQNIYVRVDSQLNNECLGLGHHITLHVEALPIVQPLQYNQCDDDQDGYFAFDTTNLENDLLNGLSNVTVSYFDAVGNPVSMTNPFITVSQIVTVRVTNNTTTACYYETTVTFTVDDLPEAFSIPNNLIKVCDDETVPNLQDGIFAFDTSNFQNIILGSQTGMIVNYYDENGNSLPSPLPNPFVTATQDVLVEVINPINNNCFTTNTIAFEVYPLPYIDLYGTELICSNDPSFVRTINAGLEDETLQNNYTYNWYFNGSLIAGENNYELTVNTDGIYTVDVISSDGCVMTRTIQVTASNIATIQNIEIVELSNNNSIIIEVAGSGDFEYSLDNITYQDSNSFYNVEPGIYTVYIRDKNGCGVVNEDVSILGIPNFFTPNGDGYNDTWNIKGANVTFNSKTIIYIFDRYGKLLKQISPLGKGWDGTYNGELMPSSDYWYSVQLENGKILKGHFSLKR